MSDIKVSDILNTLGNIADSSVGEAGEIAKEAIEITTQYKLAQLSQSEYQELMGDLQTEKLILIQANELSLKEELDKLFTAIQQAGSILKLL
jgi:NTP pyrophosphatase (non-canonical NTP hydrolase)